MTYQDLESSVAQGKPKELYRFVGTYANYYYTSSQLPVEYQHEDDDEPHLYIPVTLKRSDVRAGTQEDDGLDLTVSMPVSSDLVRDYGFNIAPPKLELTVFRFHNLPDVRVYWRGPVNGFSVAGHVASVKSPSALSYALAGDCPSVYYQSPCNRLLYASDCGVKRADHTVQTTVEAIPGSTVVTLESVGAFPQGHFVGGELLQVQSNERRMVIAQSGNNITISFPFSRLANGDVVELVAGCNRAYTGDCATKFNNRKRFGGFPFVPNINPFENGIG